MRAASRVDERRLDSLLKTFDSYQGIASAMPEVPRQSPGFSRCLRLAACHTLPKLLPVHFLLVPLKADARDAQTDHGERRPHFPVRRERFMPSGSHDSKSELRKMIGRQLQCDRPHNLRQEHERYPQSAAE